MTYLSSMCSELLQFELIDMTIFVNIYFETINDDANSACAVEVTVVKCSPIVCCGQTWRCRREALSRVPLSIVLREMMFVVN